MKILLDTCAFLWIITDDPKLSQQARKLFIDLENEVYLSVASTWEIAIKYKLGKLPLPQPPQQYIPSKRKQHDIDSLPLDEDATLYLTKLPDLHKDPFDRILICQAVVAGLMILTPDELITQDPVRSVW
ncbi:MAG: type II toxin-antitoxin system VapC family toxin [Deltaproteobacteria bacterium]|nr:type II toxin-antitoxin system VapC family toxin [Deltaproteobacteria bacterium]MBW2662104.1 type II toxin-antitoxin system VapC family toxin [Deltaproteobacteria bacterium]